MRGARIERDHWPSWRYGPMGESAIFACEVDVPYGWTKKAGDIFIPKQGPALFDRPVLEQQLRDKGINPLGHWSVRHMKDLLDD